MNLNDYYFNIKMLNGLPDTEKSFIIDLFYRLIDSKDILCFNTLYNNGFLTSLRDEKLDKIFS